MIVRQQNGRPVPRRARHRWSRTRLVREKSRPPSTVTVVRQYQNLGRRGRPQARATGARPTLDGVLGERRLRGPDRDRTDCLRQGGWGLSGVLGERRLRGPDRDRTDCLRHAMAALYQVSYGPFRAKRLPASSFRTAPGGPPPQTKAVAKEDRGHLPTKNCGQKRTEDVCHHLAGTRGGRGREGWGAGDWGLGAGGAGGRMTGSGSRSAPT